MGPCAFSVGEVRRDDSYLSPHTVQAFACQAPRTFGGSSVPAVRSGTFSPCLSDTRPICTISQWDLGTFSRLQRDQHPGYTPYSRRTPQLSVGVAAHRCSSSGLCPDDLFSRQHISPSPLVASTFRSSTPTGSDWGRSVTRSVVVWPLVTLTRYTVGSSA